MPEGWGQNKSVPDSWKKGNELPENWGKQSGGNRVSGTSSAAGTNQAQESDVSISELAHTGAGLLAGTAKKIGGAAKNAVGSAGAAMSNMKDKAASYAAEHKTAVENSTEAEYQEVPDYVTSPEEHDRSVDEMIEEALAASGDAKITDDTDTLDNTAFEDTSETEIAVTNEGNEENREAVDNGNSGVSSDTNRSHMETFMSGSSRILLSEEAVDLDTKISYLKKEISLKEHELNNTSAMAVNKKELKNEVDNYIQILSSGTRELHGVNTSDVLKYCAEEDVIGKTVSWGSLNDDFIEWTIIKNTGPSITMLSNDIVFSSPFDMSGSSEVLFKNSYIYQLLNSPALMTKLFSLEEAAHITELSLPKQSEIAQVNVPDLNKSYWVLSASNSAGESPHAMDSFGNIIGENATKELGVRLKMTISPDINYDIIKVYEEQENAPKKSGGPKKILLIAGGAVAAIAIIIGGVFAGTKLIHHFVDKGGSSDTGNTISEVMGETTDEDYESTSIDEVDEESTDPDPNSLDDAAISICNAANSALYEMDEKYGIPSESIILFSSDSKYRFYFNNSIDQHEEEFEDVMRMYCSDIDNLNYILEIDEYQCISVVVEGPDGEIGRYSSEGSDDALFIPNTSGTFKEIADQALANAQKYMEEHPAPVVTGNKLRFYSSDKINDYPVYLEKLRDLQTNGTYRDQNNGFFLCDINEDDTPELFVTFNTEEPDILFAGSVYSGELVTFAEFTGAGMLRGITLFDNGAIGIASGGNEGYGMSYNYYSGGYSFSDQNNNDEYISYIYENGSLSYISYQNGGQEKHITEAEVEQIEQKYVEASYTAEPVSSVIDNGSNMQSSQYSGFTFFDSIDKVKSELSNYYLIDEEDSVSISNQNQHLIYYEYPSQENIGAQICLCFIDNKLTAVNFRFVSATYTTSEIFNNIRDNISAKYGQPDSSDTGALNWFVEPFGPATSFFLYSYDNTVQFSFFTDEDNPYINDLLPIDISNTFLTLS